LVIARTIEAFPTAFNLPPGNVEAISAKLSDFSEASSQDIRTASLTKLDHFPNQDEVKASLALWIESHLPEASDQDALWILQHHRSQSQVGWWRSGVSEGIVTALSHRSRAWRSALWRWWAQTPIAIEWIENHLDGSATVEEWLSNGAPAEVHDELVMHLVLLCEKFDWGTLLARTLGRNRPLIECVNSMRSVLRSPDNGIGALLKGRSDTEIVFAAVETDWLPLINQAAEITRRNPKYFDHVIDTSGLISLLSVHMRIGGTFPGILVNQKTVNEIFEGVIQQNEQCEFLAGFLGAPAGVFALDHPDASKLLSQLNAEVVQGAALEWWGRFIEDEGSIAPPTGIRKVVIDSVINQCRGRSILLILRVMTLITEISEDLFIEWLKNTGFFWSEIDYQQVADFLVSRNWRAAARSFRYSWKQELKMVAWYARELLSWSDKVLFECSTEALSINGELLKSVKYSRRQKLRITFLASNPSASNRLALDEEARLIEEKVRNSKHRDKVKFRTRWAVRPEDLQQFLLEDEPAIVHFSGHGGGKIGIVLHSQDQDEERLVAEEALADLFRIFKNQIKVVVLNACFSEVQAAAIVKEIDIVIGMSDSVGDEAARVFAAAFYRGLAFGQSVKTAFDLGVNDLRLLGFSHEDHIPRLLVRPGLDAANAVLVRDEK
jgi:hypothetical protein